MTSRVDAPLDGSQPDGAQAAAQPRSRRAILAAALGGLVGSVATALGRPLPTEAAAGDNLKLGQSNFAGTAATRLTTKSSGGAFWMTQNGFGSAVRGDSVNGHGGVFNTDHADRYGLNAANTAAAGAGGAVDAAGGSNHGLVASTTNTARYAVKGTTTGADPYTVAIYGEVTSSAALQGSAGVSGVNKGTGSIAGVGVFGSHAGGGYGVQGYSASGQGVIGSSASGVGVHGLSTYVTGIGVEGVGNGEFGSGVNGSSIGSSGHGLSGSTSSTSSTASGIYGYGPDPAFAGYFEGNVSVTGTLSAPASLITLDHPLDPSGKVLQHAAVASSELKTVYDGTVTTDARGRATIQLPSWFDALNTDVRYQLTAVGRPAQAWVSDKLARGRFGIRTSEPGTEVCWQVTGVRRDAYAHAHPLSVESAKTGHDAGRYLHPVELGHSAAAGIGYETIRRYQEQAARAPKPPMG